MSLLVLQSSWWGRERVALLSLSSWCLVIVVWLFLAVLWVYLQFVIVVFPDHTHLLFFQSWSGSKLFDLLTVSLKEFFEKVNFEKSQHTTTKAWKIRPNKKKCFSGPLSSVSNSPYLSFFQTWIKKWPHLFYTYVKIKILTFLYLKWTKKRCLISFRWKKWPHLFLGK